MDIGKIHITSLKVDKDAPHVLSIKIQTRDKKSIKVHNLEVGWNPTILDTPNRGLSITKERKLKQN